MKKTLLAIGLATMVACGGGKTVYVVSEPSEGTVEEAPDTSGPSTSKAPVTTAKAPRPPASTVQPSPSSTYDPEGYDSFLWESVNDFWWLFTTEELLTMGLLVCEEFDRGQTLDQVTELLINAMTSTRRLELMEGFAAVTAASVTFLCPEHSWWLDTI